MSRQFSQNFTLITIVAVSRWCLSVVIALTLTPWSHAQEDAHTESGSWWDPPIGGWPSSPVKGNVNDVVVEGLNDNPVAKYMLGVPDSYTPTKAYPLVIVLHGSASGIDTGEAQSIASVYRPIVKAYGGICVAPMDYVVNNVLEWVYPYEMAYVAHIIKSVAKTYRIDPQRVFVVGHSMGGNGAWMMGGEMNDVWAGIGPAAGYWQVSIPPKASRLSTMPYYLIHGTQDASVPISQGDYADNLLKNYGYKLGYDRPNLSHSGILTHNGLEYPGRQIKSLLWVDANQANPVIPRLRPTPADLDKALTRIDTYSQEEGFDWTLGKTPIGKLGESWMSSGRTLASNRAPIITAGPSNNPALPSVGQEVSFSLTASDADSGDWIFTRWSFGDGTVSWSRNPKHIYRDAGTYTVSVEISDDFGKSINSSLTCVVTAPSGVKPTLTSANTVHATIQAPLSFALTASHNPTLFHCAGLPAPLLCDPTTGQISGTPRLPGVFPITVRAYNTVGSAQQILTLTITDGIVNQNPVITKPADGISVLLP